MRERLGRTFLLGATSITGWNLLSHPRGGGLVPFCNPHARIPACRGWRRFRLEDREAYRALFREETPDAVIHCGGVCDVEKCETDPAWARAVNVEGLEHLLDQIPRETRLVYVSSDHVFGGRPAPYDERSRPAPISVYGEQRAAAERLIRGRRPDALILRYALGIGPSIDGRSGHLDWLRHRNSKGLPMTIVRDEWRSAVWAEDLARRILDYTASEVSGIRHIAAERAVSRIELAESLNSRYGLGIRFLVRSRTQVRPPHLGRVELATTYRDRLARPLPSALQDRSGP
ncbi:SDR family oxidoreductase [Elusimicrobiota bacterium]